MVLFSSILVVSDALFCLFYYKWRLLSHSHRMSTPACGVPEEHQAKEVQGLRIVNNMIFNEAKGVTGRAELQQSREASLKSGLSSNHFSQSRRRR